MRGVKNGGMQVNASGDCVEIQYKTAFRPSKYTLHLSNIPEALYTLLKCGWRTVVHLLTTARKQVLCALLSAGECNVVCTGIKQSVGGRGKI